jgi:hypothetical protein
MRINTAWHHDAVARIHHANTCWRSQASWRCDGDDFFARYADFRRPNGVGCYDTIALDDQVHGNTPDWRNVAPSRGKPKPKIQV